MSETLVTMSGNVVADPELRFMNQSGTAACNFSIASTPRKFNKQTNEWEDGATTFLRVNAFRQNAEGASDVLRKGDAVIVTGKLKQRSYEKDNVKHTVYELEADEIGKSVRARGGSKPAQSQPAADPWGVQESAPF